MGYSEGCEWDDEKSELLPYIGIRLEDCVAIVNSGVDPWGHPSYPGQLRKAGYIEGKGFFTVAFEEVTDGYGFFIHIITAWPSTKVERRQLDD